MGHDRLRAKIEAELVVEREGWAVDRVRRVTGQLQTKVPAAEWFETIVIRSEHHTAFTAPGRTIYMSRNLLDQLPDDGAAAFVIAHEMAHHHLGHTTGSMVAGLFDRHIHPHEHELHADLHAIELCMDAGYDPERCILALQILDAMFLSSGDLEGSLGSEIDPHGEIARRGYLPVRQRIEQVQAHVAAYRAGTRIAAALNAERSAARKKRNRMLLGAAGSLVASLALMLLRRR